MLQQFPTEAIATLCMLCMPVTHHHDGTDKDLNGGCVTNDLDKVTLNLSHGAMAKFPILENCLVLVLAG